MAFMLYFVNIWLLSYLVIIVSNILKIEEKFFYIIFLILFLWAFV